MNINQKRALADLNKNGHLSVTPSGLTFSAAYFPGCEEHSLHSIQQLVSDQRAVIAEFDKHTGYFTKITKTT